MSTKKSTAKKVPAKKIVPVKKITPAAVQAVKKSVAKKKAVAKKTPTVETNLQDLIVRMAYTYIPDVMVKTVAEVVDWKEFVEQIEIYLGANLVNALPAPEVKE